MINYLQIDYGDVVYDQPHNETFCSKLESIQYNAALAIAGTIHGTSKTKLYVELGLESLKARHCKVHTFTPPPPNPPTLPSSPSLFKCPLKLLKSVYYCQILTQ